MERSIEQYRAEQMRKRFSGEPFVTDEELLCSLCKDCTESTPFEVLVDKVRKHTSLSLESARALTAGALRSLEKAGKVNHVKQGYWCFL